VTLKRYGMPPTPSIKNQDGPHSGELVGPVDRLVSSRDSEGFCVGTSRRVQIQVPLPYGREPRQDERIKQHLDSGWRISQLQRLTDQEVLVTFEVAES